ncbi:ATP synthase delta chain [Forsythia ovata]|uniref:ATP synthase delta chain n=1 Tax=Forsythia ovata TaxID=205694 RepID=A0ABD1X9L1_9LAMI
MDTLSSSVHSLKIPSTLHSTLREIYHFKNSKSSHHHLHPNLQFCYSTTKCANSISTKTNSSQPPSPKQSSSRTEIAYQKAASGYATVLLDMAQCNNLLEAVEVDIRRLSK